MTRQRPALLICDARNRIYDHPYLEPAGMKAGLFFGLDPGELVRLPFGSEILTLPRRIPVGYDQNLKRPVPLEATTLSGKSKRCFAVAAFISPGHTATYSSAYVESGKPPRLPLFSYAPVAFYKGGFYTACIRVDRELRHDLRHMKLSLVRENARKLKRFFPGNRLIRHLETCAITHGCPNAKNLFLSRYEAPLPTSPHCNALCMGCISYQPEGRCPATQPRISFVPSPEEVSEIALFHINNVRDPVVSFGQGCEGEPLLAGDILEKSIKLIRRGTSRGMINLNTNASRPDVMARLFDAGLDSVRVSLNSARPEYHKRYFRPKSYDFNDVMKSIKTAKEKKGFVSVNYLTMPGFTDTKSEFDAFKSFIEKHGIDMVQWRNLNYDPLRYFSDLRVAVKKEETIGIGTVIKSLRNKIPGLMMGYFNPSKSRIKRASDLVIRLRRCRLQA